MRRYIIAACLLISFPFGSFAQKVQTVEGEYLYINVPENQSLEVSKRIAVERAMINALAEAFGTDLSQAAATTVKNSNGQSDVTTIAVGTTNVKGEWLEHTREPKIDPPFYQQGMLCIKAHVWGRAREITSASIDIDARILRNGIETKFESDSFRNGDDMYLYFHTPTKGYLTVYLVDTEQQAFCLLPYMRDESGRVVVKNNVEYIFFSEQTATENKNLVDEYTLTCDSGVEINDIYIIFSPKEFIKANDKQKKKNIPRELDFAKFQEWLTNNRLKDKQMVVVRKTISIQN